MPLSTLIGPERGGRDSISIIWGLRTILTPAAPVFTFPYILNLFWGLAFHSLGNRQVHSCSIQPTVASSLEAVNTNQNKQHIS